MQLRVERQDTDDVPVLAVNGELDLTAGPRLREALLAAIEEHQGERIVLDLDGVDFIDSAGLGVLVGGLQRTRNGDGELVLVATGRNVLKVLELTGLNRAFQIHPSREAALRG